MKFAVLVSALDQTGHCLDGLETARNPHAYDPHPHNTYDVVPLRKSEAVKQLVAMVRSGEYDVFLNLCEGSWFDQVAGEEVVRTLQRLNAPFTGARLPFYSISKKAMKMAAHSCGVAIPDHMFVYDAMDLEMLKNREWQFPLIVKHHDGHDSIGMDKDSKVNDMQSLVTKTESVMKEFGGALVEQFIDGPEFTVLVIIETEDFRPYVYNPVRCIFRENEENFKHFDAKWKDYNKFTYKSVENEKLREELKSATLKIFKMCEGTGYARCDFRLDIKTNTLYFLEINANCSVFYGEKEDCGSADEILKLETRGHGMFLRRILRNALKYRDMAMPNVKVAFTHQKGFHIVAAKDLKVDQVVLKRENEPTRMVSEKYLQNFDADLKKVVYNYGVKLSQNVYGIWSENPDEWFPQNHSCNPNTWLNGLDVVARKEIEAGKELTIDYATYAAMDECKFECKCGSENCRKFIDPAKDCFDAKFKKIYGDNVCDYVKSRSAQNGVVKMN